MPPSTRLSSAAVPRPSLKGSRGGAAGNSVRRRGLLSRTSATRVDLRCGPRGKCRSGREPLRSHRTPGGERHCPGPIECNRPRRSLAKLAQTIPDPIPDTPGGLWRVALTLMIRVRPRPRPPRPQAKTFVPRARKVWEDATVARLGSRFTPKERPGMSCCSQGQHPVAQRHGAAKRRALPSRHPRKKDEGPYECRGSFG